MQLHDTTWIRLQGSSATRDLWVHPVWEGMPEYGPWLLDDGRDITDVIAHGDAEELPFETWFVPSNGGKRLQDLLWDGGLPIIPASTRFIDVLRSSKATGYSTFEIDVRWRGKRGARGEVIPGYLGLLIESTSSDTDLRRHHEWLGFSFLARPHIVDALLAAGVDGFDHEVYAPDPTDPNAFRP